MSATYVIPPATAKDRVRFLIADKSAPFRWQDEEISFVLTQISGEFTSADTDEIELRAAIALMESDPQVSTGGTTTRIKQGSVERETGSNGGSSGFETILLNLRRRLARLTDSTNLATVGRMDGPSTASMNRLNGLVCGPDLNSGARYRP